MTARGVGAAVLGALAFAAGGFLVGRSYGPERVVHEETVLREAASVTYTTIVTTVAVRERRNVRRATTVVRQPDGTTTRTRTEVDLTQVDTDSRTGEASATSQTSTEQSTLRTVTENRKDWRVGALVGTQLSLNAERGLSVGPVVYGAHAERRIAGPFFFGAWGLSNGSLGLSLSAEF
jgi:hypothetical protein